jgi:hypothetical protein
MAGLLNQGMANPMADLLARKTAITAPPTTPMAPSPLVEQTKRQSGVTLSGASDPRNPKIPGVTVSGLTKKEREKRRIRNLQTQMSKEAKRFQQNLPNYTAQQYQSLLPEYQRAQEEGLRSIREGSARRGLLQSGLRQGAEGNLRTQLAGELATSRVNINREAEQLARSKKEAASSVGLQMMTDNLRRAEELYNMQLSNQVARRQAFGQIASGIGYGVGSYYGSRPNTGAKPLDPTLWSGNMYTPGTNYGGVA